MLYQPSEATPEEILDVTYIFTVRLTNLARTYHAFRAGLVDNAMAESPLLPDDVWLTHVQERMQTLD